MRVILFFGLLLSFLSKFAQDPPNVNFVELNQATWYMQGSNWNTEEFSVSSKDYFQISTKLGKIDATGNTFYKVNSTLPFDLGKVPTKQFLIRIDSTTGNLFVRSFMDDDKEYLLYDFNLNKGDTIQSLLTLNLSQTLVVTSINSIEVNGTKRKQIVAHINGDIERRSFKFTEGIGSVYGFIVDLNSQRENITVLKCYTSSQQTIYENGTCKTAPNNRQRPTRTPRTVIVNK